MSKEKKERPVESGKYFVNPYAFINIDEECVRKPYESYENDGKDELLTGYMVCQITTKTPIFIPNITEEYAFKERVGTDKKSYDFFSYDDISEEDRTDKYSKPIIPGSEIRGVIRSAYEAAFNCCMSSVDLERDLYKRTNEPKNPGFLIRRNGRWVIKPADSKTIKNVNEEKMKTVKEGQGVFVKNINSKKTYVDYNDIIFDNPEIIIGYIHKGEEFGNRKCYSLFIYKNNEEEFEVNDECVDRLRKVLKLYRDERINIKLKERKEARNNKATWFDGYEIKNDDEYKDGEKILIYYSNDKKYLSPSCITKEVFMNKIKDILINQGNHVPCNKINNICEACYLFGMVGEDNDNSLNGKIRFTDAEAIGEEDYKNYFGPIIGLKELASPKISATEFYMKRPEEANKLGVLWNYDYYIDRHITKKEDAKNERKFINNPKIRGRKFYWHSSQIKDVEPDETSIRSCVVRPVKDGKTFIFKVYFNNLSKSLLTKLIWVMSIENDEVYCHKIGRGKPIGFGSIKINVQEIVTRKIEIEGDVIKYSETPLSYESLDFTIIDKESKSIKEFLKITDFENKPSCVDYPKIENVKEEDEEKQNKEESYRWFMANREVPVDKCKISSTKQAIYKVLPEILDEDITLPIYRYESIKNSSNSSEKNKVNHNYQNRKKYSGGKENRNKNKGLTYKPFEEIFKDLNLGKD